MGAPEFVLDANAFADRAFLHWLKGTSFLRVMPVVAYAELAVHYTRSARLDLLRAGLRHWHIDVEWMRASEAETAGATGATVGDFAVHGRDHLIAAHAAAPNRFLVTRNVKDFSFLPRVVTPPDAMRRFGGKRQGGAAAEPR